MIASLPMYDLPETRSATDALWAGIARHLRAEGVAEVPARSIAAPTSRRRGEIPRCS